MLSEELKKNLHQFIHVNVFPPIPRAADREVCYFTVFLVQSLPVLLSFSECQHRPLAPSYGMSWGFYCLSDPAGHISPVPGNRAKKRRMQKV